MKNPADELEKFKLSAGSRPEDSAKVISVGLPDSGRVLNGIIQNLSPGLIFARVKSIEEKILDHTLGRQRFALRFLSLIVLPSTFLVAINVEDEKIRASCLSMTSLIVGALIQESGSQRNPRSKGEEKE